MDNGQAPQRVRIDRGNPDKTISVEDASAMLMAWRERNPAQFGHWLSAAVLGVEPNKSARPVTR